MRPSLKALAALLAYPEQPVIEALPEVAAILGDDAALPAALRARLIRFTTELHGEDLIDAQERYVALFDRSRHLSLHLFEHVHGDSRERGPAMVDLAQIYRKRGLMIRDNELPDYLPLYLEYAAQLDAAAGAAALRDVTHILAILRDRLAKRQSPYAAVFDAMLAVAGADAAARTGAGAEDADDADEDDLDALDRAWEEAAVTFGPENNPEKSGDCGRAQDILRRMNAL